MPMDEACLSDPDNRPKTSAEAMTLASGLQGSLSERLATYRQHSERLRPEFGAAYDRLVALLAAIDGGKVGPAVGEPMPNFLLPNQQGQLISLDDLLHAGPAVISMNRGHWCPYCRLDMRALAKIEPDIRRLGTQLVSIMPETAKFTKKSTTDCGFPFPILSDVDLSYALSLGLVFWIGAEVKKLYAEIDVDLERFQGNRNYFLPMAAKFIVGRDGIVKARQVNVDFRLRMEPDAILEALAQL